MVRYITGKCSWCGEAIYEDERVYDLQNRLYHAECVEQEMTVLQVLKLLEVRSFDAEREGA